jgi:hypothetical protein
MEVLEIMRISVYNPAAFFLNFLRRASVNPVFDTFLNRKTIIHLSSW